MPVVGPIGRQPELAQLDAFLDGARTGLRGLAVTGPAGIGKTTVWQEGARRAGEQGWLVLSARPSGAEAHLSFAGLADLLATLGNGVLDELPSPQRYALDVALSRESARETRQDAPAVSAAVLSVLRKLGGAAPVLVAVDDAQWLDAATAAVLAFGLRRLEALPVGVLVSVRVERDRADTFERVLPVERRREVQLGPLSVAALHDILERELGLQPPRPELVRIGAASGGNPFYALEIARELQRTGARAGARMPVPEEVRLLVRSRLSRLPEPTQEALLIASCLTRPTSTLVDVEALVPAEEAGVVRVEGDRIHFAHPLLASGVYDAAPAGRTRRVHRWLAERVDDLEEQARHLALAVDRSDEAVARALDRAASHAAARGASAAAAELARRALELTSEPGSEIRVKRSLALAHYLRDAGDTAEASAVLEACDPEELEGDLRAELLHALGYVCWFERDFPRGYRLVADALEHARSRELAARIHIDAAWLSSDLDPTRAIEHVDAVLALLDPDDSPGLYSKALLHGTYLRLITGQGADEDAYERGRALQERNASWDDLSAVIGMWPLFKDEFSEARAFFEWALERGRAEGDETDVQGTLARLVEIECWTGNWIRADQLAVEAVELTDQIGSPAFLGSALYARGLVDAHLGRVEEARSAGERIVEQFPTEEGQAALGYWVLGFLAFSMEDPAAADAHFARAAAIIESINQPEPARFRFHPDQVEAAIQLGELGRAEALLAALDERGRVFPRPWILATTARCRGLLRSAGGDLDGALDALNEALEHHTRLEMPFERARTLLVLGQLLRRRKERRASRATLEESLAVFAELGAPLWVKRTQAELARVPVRRAPSELTPTELGIARLAATGLTNRAIAERMYVSAKTVEGSLARVYRKLDIHSRAELGRAMAERERVVET